MKDLFKLRWSLGRVDVSHCRSFLYHTIDTQVDNNVWFAADEADLEHLDSELMPVKRMVKSQVRGPL